MNGLAPLLTGWNKKKRFVNVFACEKFPACQVKVEIALKFPKLSIFFLNSPEFLKLFLMSKIGIM